MTVIAFDGRYVAADRQATSSGLKGAMTKLFVHEGKVLAFNGCADHGLMLLLWYKSGALPATFPAEADEKKNAHMLVFERGRHPQVFENRPVPMIREDAFTADGHGRDFAMAAMHLGKSAKEAVELANIYDAYCGMGVDVIDLWELGDDQRSGDGAGPGATPGGPEAAR